MELTEVDQKIFFLVRETLQKVITDRNDKPITTFSDNLLHAVHMDKLIMKKGGVVSKKKTKVFDEYDVVEFLGRGSFGVALEVKHKGTGLRRAVKLIPTRGLPPKLIDLFTKEFEIMKHLDHPNCIHTYEMFEEPQGFAIVTEILTGGDICLSLGRMEHFTEQTVARVGKQLFQALNYLHKHNIIHRDLKPDNIMLEEGTHQSEFVIRVIDFGLSAVLSQGQKYTDVLGTPLYMAPEVIKKEGSDHQVDLWAAGCIIYEMLSGRPPFLGKTLKEVQEKILNRFYNKYIGCTEDATDLIEKLLVVDPNERMTVEQALEHPYIKNCEEVQPSLKDLQEVLENMKLFQAHKKLQQVAMQYLVTHTKENDQEAQTLRKLFQRFDKNHDGTLSPEEILEGYQEIHGLGFSVDQVKDLIRHSDLDQSGNINYSEFLITAMNKEKLLSEEKMKNAFDFFDKDKSGSIDVDEVKEALGFGEEMDEKVWVAIMNEADANKDGLISYGEFKAMLLKLIPDRCSTPS